MSQAVTIALAPNYQADDVALAAGLLAHPSRWVAGGAAGRLEAAFREWLSLPAAVSFVSGRAALQAVLEAMALPPDAEVAVQAFTCVAVPSAVQWAKARPVFIDIDPQTYTMDAAALEAAVTPRMRAVVVQHTFGLAADLTPIMAVARRHGLAVIEDCAHAMGATYRGRLAGVWGDAAIFSFGRDKCLSAVFGGIAVTARLDIAKRLYELKERTAPPPHRWVGQQLLHPLLTTAARSTLGVFAIGEMVLGFSRTLGLISPAVERDERQGTRPSFAGYRLPNALAVVALAQLGKLDRYNRHREIIAARYATGLTGLAVQLPPPPSPDRRQVYLRYTIRTQRRQELVAAARRSGLHLGDWYWSPVAPIDVKASAVGYQAGCCPRAEQAAREVMNLPTHVNVSPAQADRVISFLRQFFS